MRPDCEISVEPYMELEMDGQHRYYLQICGTGRTFRVGFQGSLAPEIVPVDKETFVRAQSLIESGARGLVLVCNLEAR